MQKKLAEHLMEIYIIQELLDLIISKQMIIVMLSYKHFLMLDQLEIISLMN